MSDKKSFTLKKVHAFEQLAEINEEKNVFKQQELLKQYGSKSPLNWLLPLNFKTEYMLDLPEGMPPLDLKDMDEAAHPDTFGLLAGSIPRLIHCTKKSKLTKNKKEQILYEVMVSCPLKDAEIVCSAKDKALTELYPNITKELVGSIFPAYVL